MIGRGSMRGVVLAAVVPLSSAASCRKGDDEMGFRLRYTHLADVEAVRASVDVEVNGIVVRRLPELEDRDRADYDPINEKVDLTRWIEDGDNEVVFRVAPGDDSGLQHRSLELRSEDVQEGGSETIFASDSRELGVFRTTVTFGGDAVCDELTPAERDEVVARVRLLHDAVTRADKSAIEPMLPPGDELADLLWAGFEAHRKAFGGGPPEVSPFRNERLKITKSCRNDAVFVNANDGAPLIRYEFSSSGGRARSIGALFGFAFRKVKGEWFLVY